MTEVVARGPGEQRVAEALDRMVAEGRPRLHRRWAPLLATGALGGLDVGVGILTLLAVQHETGSAMLAGLAFSIGFIALLLAHSELFTEGFLVPVAVVGAGEASVRDLLRMWAAVLVSNLAGGWVFTWLIMVGFPNLRATAIQDGSHFVNGHFTLQTFVLAPLAGGVITLMTRMQQGTDSMAGKMIAAIALAFVLAGLRLWHSILDSLVAFAGLHSGRAPYGYLDWLAWLGWTVLGNLVGGVGLTTLLRMVRSAPLLAERREQAQRRENGQAARSEGRP